MPIRIFFLALLLSASSIVAQQVGTINQRLHNLETTYVDTSDTSNQRTFSDLKYQTKAFVNVKELGAVCDGVTNDATAFNNAVNSLGDDGGTIVISGVMGLGTTGWTGIELLNKSNITIKGADQYSGVKLLAVASQSIVGKDGIIKLTNCDNITITDLRVYGNNIGSGFIIMDSVINSTISNLTIDSLGAGDGIFSAGGFNNHYLYNQITNGGGLGLLIGNTNAGYGETNALVEGNYIYNNVATGINGIFANSVIINNTLISNGGSGIALSSYNAELSYNTTVSNNYCAYNSFHGIQSDVIGSVLSKGISISGNILVDNASAGIYINKCSDWVVSTNIIKDNLYGIFVSESYDIIINNNQIYNQDDTDGIIGVQLSAVSIGTEKVQINNNSIKNFLAGIALNVSVDATNRNINIHSNQIDSCGDYGIAVFGGDTIGIYNNNILHNGIDMRLDVATTGFGNLYSSISGVEPSSPSQSDNSGFISSNDFFSHSSFGSKKIFNPILENALYNATSRFTVSDTGFTGLTQSKLFDNLYGDFGIIPEGDTGKVYIDLTSKSEFDADGITYTAAYILVHFFYTSKPASISGSFLLKDSTNWIPFIGVTDISTDTSYAIYRLGLAGGYTKLTKLRLFIVGGTSTAITEIECYFTNPRNQFKTPTVSKFGANSLYNKLSWKNYANTEVAYIDSNGNASFSNLGVSTGSPDSTLTVDGGVHITGGLKVDGSVTAAWLVGSDTSYVATWGTITGDINTQTDLTALVHDSVNTKQNADADLTDLSDGELTASKVGGVKDADYGDVTVSGGAWSVEDNSHSHTMANITDLTDSLAAKMNRAEMSGYATASHTHSEFADTIRVAGWSMGMGNTNLDTLTAGSFGGIKIENNYTITEVSAYTNSGTVTFNIEERAEVTPNTTGVDVITSDLVADTDQQETGTFSNAAIDRDDWLVLTIVSITGDPTIFSVTVRGVKTN